MSFVAKLQRARDVLEQQGRLSVRALGRELDLGGDELDELIGELVDVQAVAVREGNVLVWAPHAGTTAPRSHTSPRAHSRPTPPDPHSYTPKHLAEKILQSKSALEGERKQVTVLFADVKGSMELSEQLDPEAWHAILDRFFAILTDGVHRFEGTVNQYTGDGIMALFGAPIAHEDHAQRACWAGLYLRDELRAYTREVKQARGVDFGVRVGLNSGEVIVGKIGDDLRMDYTAQGHTVGLAQRMEALAPGGSVYLSARTAALVAGYFELEDLGEFAIKGVAEAMRVFELCAVGAARTRFDLSRARGLSRVVGRADEMALLETALDQALAGPGRTVGVVAQAGTGKTRLCHEFINRCRDRGLTVYEARGLAHGKHIPLLPVLELMRAFFGIDARDSEAVAREKIAARLLDLDESLRDELPIFFDLLAVPDPARPLPAADPEALQRRMHAAVRRIAQIDGERNPGVILIEDLHWLDPASDTVLHQIIEGNAASRSLVLVNFRPEYQARWMRQAHYQQLSLLPLSEAALRELLDELLGRDASVAALPAAIYARTRGNPFFIEEIVQSLVGDGHLEGQRGAYRLTTRVETLPLPESVQGVLAARIDRLPEREKHVLQSASVIGMTFRERVLRRMVDLRGDGLGEALRALQDGELLYEAALYPEIEYTFKHPLTQEVAAKSQLSERRTRAHALVARAIEELDAEHLDERAALLAHHWEHAAEPERAAAWHARAAAHIGTTSYQESYNHWRRVEELLRDAKDTEHVRALRTRSYHEELRLAFRVGMPEDEAAALYARARAFLVAHGDEQALAVLTCHYSALRQSAGDLPAYLELMEEAMAMARRAGDPATRAALAMDLLYARLNHGSLMAAVDAGDEALLLVGDDVQMGTDIIGFSPLIMNLAFSAYALAQMGQLAEAERRLQRAMRLAHAEAAPETLSWLTYPRIELEVLRGDPGEALRAGRQGLEEAERSGSRFDAVAARCWLGQAHVAAGNWRDAAELLESAATLAREQTTALDIVLLASWALPTAHLGLGDIGRARALADAAVELCRAQRARVFLCRAHLARAAIARADPQAQSGQAEADLDAAEQLVAETGAHALLPAIHEGRAALATGAERERHLGEAQRLYRAMGATGHGA